jgi:uroporphyrinogen decarboxylase
MSRFELLRETLLGNLSDRIPYSLWKHYPNKDRTPEGLAESEIAFHQEYDHDIIKISFHGRYPVVDWGCIAIYDGAISGSTICANCVIEQAPGWETLEPLDVNTGEFGKQLKAVELIHEYTEGKIPTMATVFDATMVASKLCEGKVTDYINSNPDIMKSVLQMINKVMIDFGKAALDAGADGIFLASQHSTHSSISDEQYRNFVLPFNAELIRQLRGKARFTIMHLHARDPGEEIRFEEIARTPGLDAINWEDQSAKLNLSEGKVLSGKTVVGGIDHNGIFRSGTPDQAKQQVLDAAAEAGLAKLIVAPGCVITVDTPRENIRAVADAVSAIDPFFFGEDE